MGPTPHRAQSAPHSETAHGDGPQQDCFGGFRNAAEGHVVEAGGFGASGEFTPDAEDDERLQDGFELGLGRDRPIEPTDPPSGTLGQADRVRGPDIRDGVRAGVGDQDHHRGHQGHVGIHPGSALAGNMTDIEADGLAVGGGLVAEELGWGIEPEGDAVRIRSGDVRTGRTAEERVVHGAEEVGGPVRAVVGDAGDDPALGAGGEVGEHGREAGCAVQAGEKREDGGAGEERGFFAEAAAEGFHDGGSDTERWLWLARLVLEPGRTSLSERSWKVQAARRSQNTPGASKRVPSSMARRICWNHQAARSRLHGRVGRRGERWGLAACSGTGRVRSS